MSRARITIVALVVASGAAALVAAVAGAGGSATPTTMTLVAVDLPKTEVYVDTGKKGEIRIPIVGGTKAHAGARGEIRFTELGEKATRYLITLVD